MTVRKLLRLAGIIASGAVILAVATGGSVAIARGFFGSFSSATPNPVASLSVLPGQPSTIYADDGTTVLAVEHGSVNRLPVNSLSDVSPIMQQAVLDTEDARFYHHGGFDIPSTIRALASNASASGGVQGGSTLTQQLVKQLYLTPQRALSRKIKEAVIADRLQKQYTKQQIFTAYLNTIYLGNGAYGVKAAAEEYFNEQPNQITMPQAALLAGLIQDPSGYNPIAHPALAKARRAHVLDRMVHYHTVTPQQATQANQTPLPTTVNLPQASATVTDGFYVDQVKNFLLNSPNSPLGNTYSARYNALFEGGLHIVTNLDPRQQGLAENSVNTVIDPAGKSHGDVGAMVAIDPATGKVRAVVGGPTYTQSNQFDIATDAHRQPGSGFKLFTLLAAYQQGFGPNDTIDGTAPCIANFAGFGQIPPSQAVSNAEPGGGVMTIHQATANSVNCAFIRLASQVGLANIVHQANLLGLSETFQNPTCGTAHLCPSLVIGGDQGVTVLQMANAYATVDDNGVYHNPSFIDHITNGAGATIYNGAQPGKQVVPVDVDHQVLADLQGVVQAGTGVAAQLGAQPAAGKTGTTDNGIDAWFNGLTPQLAASFWMGNPKGDSITYGMDAHTGWPSIVFGASYCAPAWKAFMAPAVSGTPVTPFPAAPPPPPGKFINVPGSTAVGPGVRQPTPPPPPPPRPPGR